MVRREQVVLVQGQQLEDGEQVALELRYLAVEDSQSVDDVDEGGQAQTLTAG
jgi:hypothetical protein